MLNPNITPAMQEMMAKCTDQGHRLAAPYTIGHIVPDAEEGFVWGETTLPAGAVILPLVADEKRVNGFCEGFWITLEPGQWTQESREAVHA